MPLIDTVEPIGSLIGITRTQVWGFCQDHNYRLVALYVSGGPTATTAIRARMSDEKANIRISTRVGLGNNERSLYVIDPKKHKYKSMINNIPGTRTNTLLVTSERLEDDALIDEDMDYSYFIADEHAPMRLYLRVKALVDIYVSPKWENYLWAAGQSVYRGRYALCGRYSQPSDKDVNYWLCAGFKIGYMQTDKQSWTEVITTGLKTKRIWEN